MYAATLTIDNVLQPTPVSLQSELTARELIEAAFVQLQTDLAPDPFKFTIAYYGYDHYQGDTTYLGYFIVSINTYVTDANDYWELFVNGKPSSKGIDSVLVEPNDVIELKWIPVAAAEGPSAVRLERVRSRASKGGPTT